MRGYTNIHFSPTTEILLAAKSLAFVNVPDGMLPQATNFSLSNLPISVRKRILV